MKHEMDHSRTHIDAAAGDAGGLGPAPGHAQEVVIAAAITITYLETGHGGFVVSTIAPDWHPRPSELSAHRLGRADRQ